MAREILANYSQTGSPAKYHLLPVEAPWGKLTRTLCGQPLTSLGKIDIGLTRHGLDAFFAGSLCPECKKKGVV